MVAAVISPDASLAAGRPFSPRSAKSISPFLSAGMTAIRGCLAGSIGDDLSEVRQGQLYPSVVMSSKTGMK